MNNIPIITAYTNIACLFNEIPLNQVTARWFFENFFNLAWDKETNELIPCGKVILNRYDAIVNCPYIEVKICTKEDIKSIDYELNKGKSNVLCPINTKLLGVTEKKYVHDVMLKDINSYGQCKVYDFWRPLFKWKSKECELSLVVSAIDFTNEALLNKIVIFQKKDISNFSEEKHIEWNKNISLYINNDFEKGRYAYGISVYDAFIDYISGFDTYYNIPIANFHILYEHYLFIYESFKIRPILYEPLRSENETLFLDLIKKIARLRNYVMKIWYNNKEVNSWKQKICAVLLELKKEEIRLLKKIIKNIK